MYAGARNNHEMELGCQQRIHTYYFVIKLDIDRNWKYSCADIWYDEYIELTVLSRIVWVFHVLVD